MRLWVGFKTKPKGNQQIYVLGGCCLHVCEGSLVGVKGKPKGQHMFLGGFPEKKEGKHGAWRFSTERRFLRFDQGARRALPLAWAADCGPSAATHCRRASPAHLSHGQNALHRAKKLGIRLKKIAFHHMAKVIHGHFSVRNVNQPLGLSLRGIYKMALLVAFGSPLRSPPKSLLHVRYGHGSLCGK